MTDDGLLDRVRDSIRQARGGLGSMTCQPLARTASGASYQLIVDGEAYFLKTSSQVDGADFKSEAYCLELLGQSAPSLTIPEAVAAENPSPQGAGFLVLPWLRTARRSPDFDERLGAGLAELHRTSSDQFGFPVDTYCGRTAQPAGWDASWPRFFADKRLGELLHRGAATGLFGRELQRLFGSVLTKLDDLLSSSEEPAALIHGDLWSGNVLCVDAGPALIDPAAFFAHREAEFGMMLLFGGFSRRVVQAYEQEYPLRAGWRERIEVYRLYHLVNHALMFGGTYVDDAVALARRLV